MSCFEATPVPVLAVEPVPLPTGPNNRPRRSVKFHPDIWSDYFLAYSSDDLAVENDQVLEHEKLKEEVRKMIIAAIEDPLRNLELVESIQRLGVSYHFQDDIEGLLQKMLENLDEYVRKNVDNLHKISLCFRLLRQQGYKVSCEMFNSFKDGEGNFKEYLKEDMEGVLSLYEATHLRVHGEDILEEALIFTVTQLKYFLEKDVSSSLLSTRINHALTYPIRKNLPRLDARFYISIYQDMPSHNQTILKFSKLDFNILQKQHQTEVIQISRWWKHLDFKRKFPFARQRIVECYFWISGMYFEPEYALGRKTATKLLSVASVLDDIYDNYGTLEELELLTQAIQGWDYDLATKLPDSMKTLHLTLLDVYNEIGEDFATRGKSYGIQYVIEEQKKVAKAYNCEVKWYHEDYIPTMEEYLPVAVTSTGYPWLSTVSFLGMGEIVTRDSFQWVVNSPKIVIASATICRLQDDIVTHEFEQKRGHSPSSVECYMKQYGVARREAVQAISKQVHDAWKDLNEACLVPTSVAVPKQLLMPHLNLTRTLHVLHHDHDGYTNPQLSKHLIASLLRDPIPY